MNINQYYFNMMTMKRNIINQGEYNYKRDSMEKFCKNCGCKLDENELFCPDCGKATENKHEIRYCPNCGEKIDHDERFCRNCGTELKKPKKESVLKKYKTPIIIVAAILAIAVVALAAFSALTMGSAQEVQVDSISFTIPEDFKENTHLNVNENDSGLIYKSKFWESDDDYIEIDVMYAEQNVDAAKIADEMGGEKTNMLGYEGYYNELDGAYAFTFVKSNKLVTVYTSDNMFLEEIEAT